MSRSKKAQKGVPEANLNCFDSKAGEWAFAHESPARTLFWRGVTFWGGPTGVALLIAALFGWVYFKSTWLAGLTAAAVVGLSVAVTEFILKPIIQRQRPSKYPPLAVETSSSFPSGHSTASAALANVLIWLATQGFVACELAIFGVLLALAIGVSRIYLRVHHLTDVLAGWLIGAGASWALLELAQFWKLLP